MARNRLQECNCIQPPLELPRGVAAVQRTNIRRGWMAACEAKVHDRHSHPAWLLGEAAVFSTSNTPMVRVRVPKCVNGCVSGRGRAI